MIKMSNEITLKEFQKLKEQVAKLENKLSDQLKKTEQKWSEQVNSFEKKITEQFAKLELKGKEQITDIDQKLVDHINVTRKKIKDLENKFDKELKGNFTLLANKLTENFNSLNSELENKIKEVNRKLDQLSARINNYKEGFDTKEEVLRDLVKKINEENRAFKSNLEPMLEHLKSEQDLVKISMDVLKNQIQESAKEWIDNEIKLACKNKEKEILMNLWIDELKEIIGNIDNLKELHPKELKLHINEISSTIESFRQKFMK
jgi:DNA repair exonuclease SbcCD ATPase subunit